jgi:transcription elongation GreA/GreB family factor
MRCIDLLERPPIVLTASDHNRLFELLHAMSTTMSPGTADFLREELERAEIIPEGIFPAAAVSIGSTVKFVDHTATNYRQAKLVSPDQANDVDRISVTGARGSALIGLGPGQTIRWRDDQTDRLRLTTVLEVS